MTITIIPKTAEQHIAETTPVYCCEGATAIVEIGRKTIFSGQMHKIRCSKCLSELSTKLFLSPR